MYRFGPMTNKTDRSVIAVAVFGLSIGLFAAGITPAAAAGSPAAAAGPQPRSAATLCAAVAPENGYVTVDPATNSSCTVYVNGTYIFIRGVTIKRNGKVRVRAGMCSKSPRGEARRFATVRYIRSGTVITKRVALNSNCIVVTPQKLKKKGLWAIVVTYRNKTVSSVVQVT